MEGSPLSVALQNAGGKIYIKKYRQLLKDEGLGIEDLCNDDYSLSDLTACVNVPDKPMEEIMAAAKALSPPAVSAAVAPPTMGAAAIPPSTIPPRPAAILQPPPIPNAATLPVQAVNAPPAVAAAPPAVAAAATLPQQPQQFDFFGTPDESLIDFIHDEEMKVHLTKDGHCKRKPKHDRPQTKVQKPHDNTLDFMTHFACEHPGCGKLFPNKNMRDKHALNHNKPKKGSAKAKSNKSDGKPPKTAKTGGGKKAAKGNKRSRASGDGNGNIGVKRARRSNKKEVDGSTNVFGDLTNSEV